MKEKWIKKFFLSFSLLIPITLLFPLENVWSATYFVKPDGTGSDCTRSAPCHFIAALTKAVSGDGVVFKEGEYARAFSDPAYAVIELGVDKGIILMGGWNGSDTGTLVINPDRHPSILNGKDVWSVFWDIRGPLKPTDCSITTSTMG